MIADNLRAAHKSEEVLTGFFGYNARNRIEENEFFYEKNMSSNSFPSVSPRNKRGIFDVAADSISGLFSKNELCFIKNNKLFVGNTQVDSLNFPDINKRRQFVSMGEKLLVFPDKVYVNTGDITDCGSLEAHFNSSGATVTFSLCMGDGTLYSDYTVSGTVPEEPENNTLWLDTSVTPNELKIYSENYYEWMPVSDTYIKITCPLIGTQFEKFDGVTLSGASVSDLNGTFIIEDKGEDYITVSGIISSSVTQNTNFTVSRDLPDMDFVCENGNRLWGCNSEKNEIYASRLGDPKNFNSFMGISTDSYAVTVGTDGEFTGAVNFRGYSLFFKENCVHKIYGSNPPFSVSCSFVRGVQKGSEGTLKILNETLYYLSPNGVCSYEGTVPLCISENLGNTVYKDGTAGVLGDRYYICMSDKNGVRTLFTYDESKNIWHREDDIDICDFATHNYNLYFLATVNNTKKLFTADGENSYGNFASVLGGFTLENPVEWKIESGLWGLGLPGNKYYSGISVRGKGETGSSFKIYFQYDDSGVWEEVANVGFTKTQSFTVPLSTPRCDTLKIKITGTGKTEIHSISRTVERGSNIYV